MPPFRFGARRGEFQSREYQIAKLVAVALPGRNLSPAAMLGGFYVAAPRLSCFWVRPEAFAAAARRLARLDGPRIVYWRRIAMPGSAAARLAKAHRVVEKRARRIARSMARKYLTPEDYLLASAALPASGIAAAILASGLDLAALRRAAAELS